jgi:hypothetical protein
MRVRFSCAVYTIVPAGVKGHLRKKRPLAPSDMVGAGEGTMKNWHFAGI